MLTLQQRIHFNAFHLAFYRAMARVRDGHTDPGPEVEEPLNVVCALRRPEMGPNLLASLVVSCRMVAPLVLNDGQGDPTFTELQERMARTGIGEPGRDLFLASSALFHAYNNDRLLLTSTLQKAGGPLATARVWALALMGLAHSMVRHCDQVQYGAEHIGLECPECRAVIGAAHAHACSYGLCIRSGAPLASCTDPRHCSVTVWEGKPTGWDVARREGLWCVDTAEGQVQCPGGTAGARVWWEGVRGVMRWKERHQTWG